MNTNLKKARSDAGITQAETAKKLGVTYQMVYQWEKGLAPVAKQHWPRLASLLHLSESELESVLVETLLDACIAKQDARLLLNAQTSRLYSAELIADALARFGGSARYPQNPSPAEPQSILDREKALEYERQIFERDKRIFELEKEIERLKKELASISSRLNINTTLSVSEAERTTAVKEVSL